MSDTQPSGGGTTSLRLNEAGAEAAHIAAQLGDLLGRRITLSDYVRQAVADRNRWARRVLAATEIPGGDIIVTSTETIVGGRTLGPGTYRIAGTTDLIQVGEATDPPGLMG